MNKHKLLELNSRGLIPGPSEEEEAYFTRCERLKNCSGNAPERVLARLQEEYDCAPDWVVINQSREGLLPWQGGCTTFDYDESGAVVDVAIQLPPLPSFLRKRYHPDEIVLHELAHVGRLAFEEPRFEEFFSYNLSDRAFHRKTGPFCHQLARAPLLTATALGVGAALAPFFTFLTALGVGGFFWNRSCKEQKTLQRCESALSEILSPRVVRPLLYRLTDAEILLFSCLSGDQLTSAIEKRIDSDLRWRVIALAYFSDQP